jgi:hypothetical protein
MAANPFSIRFMRTAVPGGGRTETSRSDAYAKLSQVTYAERRVNMRNINSRITAPMNATMML